MSEKMIRIQFELPEAKVEELDLLAAECGVRTRRELFNNALTLLEWAIKQRRNGRTIASVDEEAGSYRELHMPILNNVTTDSVKEQKQSLISSAQAS